VLVGDMDSAQEDDWAWAIGEGAEEFRHSSAKDLTDFQLALDLMDERGGASALILSGCFGGRLDHLFSTLCTFVRGGSLCMIDDREGVYLIRPGERVRAVFKRRPLAVSLLPLSCECRGVSISGVRWPLDGVVLKRDYPWAISNEAGPSGEVSARCEEGVLGFYWSYLP
jgi:thiamine pyrophosphokinase